MTAKAWLLRWWWKLRRRCEACGSQSTLKWAASSDRLGDFRYCESRSCRDAAIEWTCT